MSVLITVIVFVVSLYTVYVLMCIAYLDNSRWYLNLRALFCDCIFCGFCLCHQPTSR